jgi:hypothetical protein
MLLFFVSNGYYQSVDNTWSLHYVTYLLIIKSLEGISAKEKWEKLMKENL